MDEIYKVIRWVLDHEIELKSTFVLTAGDIVETAKIAMKNAETINGLLNDMADYGFPKSLIKL